MQDNQEQRPPYQDTLGFRMIQGHGPDELPDDMKEEMRKIMQHLATINPDDLESIVVVARIKAEGPDGQPGFGMVVASLGAQELVLGSSLMLNEYLVKGVGGMGAVMASVMGTLDEIAGPGCGDPNCETCGKGDGPRIVVDNTVTGDPKDVAAAVKSACPGSNMTH